MNILKEIDGDPHKQRSMGFNSKQREKPYQNLTSSEEPCNEVRPSGREDRCCIWDKNVLLLCKMSIFASTFARSIRILLRVGG